MTRIVDLQLDEFAEDEIERIPDLDFSITTMEYLMKKYCSMFTNMCSYETADDYIICPFSGIFSNDQCDFRKCNLQENILHIKKLHSELHSENEQRKVVMKNIKLVDKTYDRIMEGKL